MTPPEQELEKVFKSFDFVLIGCNGAKYQQLLVFRSINYFNKTADLFKKRNKLSAITKPNLNIVFVDTMSRSEFYYGMDYTLKVLRNLSKENFDVLDFKLFQSIAISTYWHLHNLFNGSNTDHAKTIKHSNYLAMGKDFFRNLKNAGYRTGYSHDICYLFDFTEKRDKPDYQK